MKLKVLIGILIWIITLIHCSKNISSGHETPSELITIDETKTANVHFVLKASVESDFIAFPKIAVSPYQDKVILYGLSSAKNEKSDLVAQTYDKSLRLLNRKTFINGQGPGDVGNFNIISIGKDKLMISENSNQRVSIYDNDWNYKTSFKYHFESDAFEIYEDGNLFVTTDYLEKGNEETYPFTMGSIYDFKMMTFFIPDYFSRYKYKGGKRLFIVNGESTSSWFYRNNKIFVLMCGSYRLIKFDSKGKELKDVIIKVEKKKTDQSLMDDYLKDQEYYEMKHQFVLSDTVDPAATLIPLSKGFIVIRRNDYYMTCNEYADGDYFSDEFQYKGKVKVPCFHKILQVFPDSRKNECVKFDNGFLYLVQEQDDKTVIEKWQVFE
ncbi:MAG: hypothetical protein ACM3SY_19070 [Candidatus Omnitrophota bacterium]